MFNNKIAFLYYSFMEKSSCLQLFADIDIFHFIVGSKVQQLHAIIILKYLFLLATYEILILNNGF